MRVGGDRWSAPCTWASGPGPWPPASCKDSWRRERRWTCPSTSARYRRSRRRGRWSGRRCASSRPSPSPSSGAAPCPPRRRSPWRTSPGCRDEVQRGRERLFHASLSVTLHAKDEASLREMTQRAKAHFAATLGKLDNLAFRQREGLALHAAPGPERRGRVAQPGHVQHRPALPLLAARPGHPKRHPLRHRHAGLLPRGLRPLGRHPSERQHRRPRPLRQRQVLCHQAGDAAGPYQGSDRLRHRPGGRVRGHGPRRGRTGALPRRPRPGHEPLRHRQGRFRRNAPAHRQPETPHRGDGGRESRRGAPRLPRPRPGGLLRPPRERTGFRDFYTVSARRRGGRRRSCKAAQALRHRQPADTCSPTRETTFSETRP